MATFSPDYRNQTDLFDPTSFGYPVHVIGCGGIGATLVPLLATLGIPEITLWDSDIIEPSNLASTLSFGTEDVLHPKVEVAAREARRLGTPSVTTRQTAFDPTEHASELSGIVISGVDSMAARRAIWDGVSQNPLVGWYFDGRIGGELFHLNLVRPYDPDDAEWYTRRELYDEDKVAPLPCAARAIVYPSAALAAVIISRLALLSRGRPIERKVVMHMATLQIMLTERSATI